MIKNIGIEVIAPTKLEKQTLFIFSFLTIIIIFWITPAKIMLPNNIFICSQMLWLAGANILVIKLGNFSYKKCNGKHKTKAIIVNSPNNPSGVVYSEKDIIALSDLLKR